jgi:hypothetical protein
MVVVVEKEVVVVGPLNYNCNCSPSLSSPSLSSPSSSSSCYRVVDLFDRCPNTCTQVHIIQTIIKYLDISLPPPH